MIRSQDLYCLRGFLAPDPAFPPGFPVFFFPDEVFFPVSGAFPLTLFPAFLRVCSSFSAAFFPVSGAFLPACFPAVFPIRIFFYNVISKLYLPLHFPFLLLKLIQFFLHFHMPYLIFPDLSKVQARESVLDIRS